MKFSLLPLLAGLLYTTYLVGESDARPYKRNAGVTLPLKRINHVREGVAPQVLLQQHVNRGHKRLARMTGREPPSDEELLASLVKRLYIPEHHYGGDVSAFGKRFNRVGLPSTPAQAAQLGGDVGVSKTAAALHPVGGGVKAIDEVLASAADSEPITLVPGNTTDTNATETTTATSVPPAQTGAGFSPVNLEAALNGGLTKAQDPTANNTVGLDIEANDVGYIATLQIGTPPRDFLMLMDSGSADTWVGAEDCRSTAGGGCGNHTFLGPGTSSSFNDSGAPFAVTYGSGNVAGTIVQDEVLVAGLALPAHPFGVANVESPEFSDGRTTFDGLVGLAQGTLSNQGVPTPIEALQAAGLVDEAITSYKLGRISDGANDGEVTFGALNAEKFVADSLTALENVSPLGFWEASFGLSVDGTDLGLQNRSAILDTGTTLILAPPADADALHAAIPGALTDGQGQYAIPCTTTAVVSLNFGGREFSIDPRDLLFVPLDPNDLEGLCLSGISAGQIGDANQWLVGAVFLKNVYFSTDVTKNTVSLASLA